MRGIWTANRILEIWQRRGAVGVVSCWKFICRRKRQRRQDQKLMPSVSCLCVGFNIPASRQNQNTHPKWPAFFYPPMTSLKKCVCMCTFVYAYFFLPVHTCAFICVNVCVCVWCAYTDVWTRNLRQISRVEITAVTYIKGFANSHNISQCCQRLKFHARVSLENFGTLENENVFYHAK